MPEFDFYKTVELILLLGTVIALLLTLLYIRSTARFALRTLYQQTLEKVQSLYAEEKNYEARKYLFEKFEKASKPMSAGEWADEADRKVAIQVAQHMNRIASFYRAGDLEPKVFWREMGSPFVRAWDALEDFIDEGRKKEKFLTKWRDFQIAVKEMRPYVEEHGGYKKET